MKILVLCSTLDLSKPFNATPALWQLFKGFYEQNHELVIIPYHGDKINSLWWKSYDNPNFYKGLILEKILKIFKSNHPKKNSTIIPRLANLVSKPSILNSIKNILSKEKDIEAVLFIAVPLNQLNGLPTQIRKAVGIPILYYDLDLPSSLPDHGGFTFNYYVNAKVDDYDSFIITSEGSKDELKKMGIHKIDFVHFGVDLDVYSPIPIHKDIDFFFFGTGGKSRRNNIDMMITEPSKVLSNSFIISGRDLDVDMGRATIIPQLSFNEWKKYCCRSKVNLNVVREGHAKVYATSTSRPFELAAMKSCIVSAPYNGLEKWFEINKEIFVCNTKKECIEIYQMLLDSEEIRLKIANAAYERVKKEHTSRHRAEEIVQIIKRTKNNS
jgi:glycosyltransferase involved in cell wall biosynthesis